MHYVVIGTHTAEVCPTGNAKTRALMLEIGPQIGKLAEQNNINILAGPFVNREHVTVVIVETEKPENLDAFLLASRLPQWNSLRIMPSFPIEQGMREINDLAPLF